MLRAAVVQHPPVFLDLEASLARAVDLVAEAADAGAGLVVFPEAWLPGYPTWVWRLRPGEDMAVAHDLHRALAANAVDLGRDGLRPLCDVARDRGVVIVAGLNEIDRAASSTLFNSAVVIDADGRIANRHRKLMPTNPERMVWGFGDASGLRVVETAAGRIGVLICWENYMPLARCALYAQRPEIYIAPTWDAGDAWLATMRHIAREAGRLGHRLLDPARRHRHPRRLPASRAAVPRPRGMDQRRRRRRAPPVRPGRGRADAPEPRPALGRHRHLRRRRRPAQLRRRRALCPPRRLQPCRRPDAAPTGRLHRPANGRPASMNALALKKGASRHSAYDLRDPFHGPEETHTLAVLVDNEAGVLARVIGLFSGRGYNIESLTVAETDHEGHLSRITIVTTGTPAVIEQIKAQLGRLVPVHDVHDLTVEGKAVQRELALIKVKGTGEKRVEAMRTSEVFRARVVDTTLESFVFELTGPPEKVDAFIALMRPLGLVDVARTGVAAIARGV